MPNKPNKPRNWIAAVLGLVSPPVGMLYTAQVWAALAYFTVGIAVGVAGFLLPAWKLAADCVTLLLAVVGAVHAYRLARQYPDDKPRPGYSRWYGILLAVVGVVVVITAIRAFFYEPFRAPSSSMLPTIPMRATLIAQKWGYGNYGTFGGTLLRRPISAPLARGDVIVFEFPEDRSISFVKRVVGLPGDKITYRGRQLSINGEPVPLRPDGNYYDTEHRRDLTRLVEALPGREYGVLASERPPFIPVHLEFPLSEKCTHTPEEISCDVPAGHYFTLGDNRDNSRDSRFWGFVPADHIVGKVVYVGS